MTDFERIIAGIEELESKNNCGTSDFIEAKDIAYRQVKNLVKSMMQEPDNVDEEYDTSKFTGLFPAWIDAPSTLQPAHKWHGRNVVAIHEKKGGFRCCCVDDKVPSTFHLPEDTHLVSGWK